MFLFLYYNRIYDTSLIPKYLRNSVAAKNYISDFSNISIYQQKTTISKRRLSKRKSPTYIPSGCPHERYIIRLFIFFVHKKLVVWQINIQCF